MYIYNRQYNVGNIQMRCNQVDPYSCNQGEHTFSDSGSADPYPDVRIWEYMGRLRWSEVTVDCFTLWTSHHLEIVLHLVLQLIIVDWMWCFQGPTWFTSFVLNAGLVQLQLFMTLVYLELLYHILEYGWHLLAFSKYLIFKKWLIYLKGGRFSLILGAS